MNDIIEQIQEAGVVGAGGAGFPTHIKLNAKADIVIANGAECEPLLHADQTAMANNTKELLAGLSAVVGAVGAAKGVLAVKAKHKELVSFLTRELAGVEKLELFLLENFYPAGDEQVLVSQVTGRIVPEGGIPLQVGAVVDNVGTLINIAGAINKRPVTQRMLTVAGAVHHPVTLSLPVGVSIGEAIRLAGGPMVDDYRVIIGGPMMGKVATDTDMSITKTTSGIIVLPAEHKLVGLKIQNPKVSMNKARSICCQCTRCTEMCPRNLLGHNLYPHKIMRAISYQAVEDLTPAYLCSECGLCGLYNCIHEIMPFQVNKIIKEELRKKGIPNPHKSADLTQREEATYRRVPTDRLIKRLGLSRYNLEAPYQELSFEPQRVNIPLKQHLGVPAVPLVKVGELVTAGQKIGAIPEGKMAAAVHASISGIVREIGDGVVIEAY